jgi:ABC-2 type transport system ATP-binding protein
MTESVAEPVAEPVVEIIGLSKRFGAGVLAVDDLTFSVEQGQVVGLLGPNGAGKTTCLRMLLGLIHPSAGETRLFGERVAPGSEQLRRLGALIESSAFVPHLSGTRNLRLWWEAGGGRWADADVDTALAIADLGTAVDRKVKTYSQGMRQRLGLARVLLGKPEILVLDEPTNGLDPGEMREVRQLVRRVAEAGSTVLFSSHVLAEVEQICTHAVVMDKGKLVATGSVSDLIGTAGTVYVEVDDSAAARRVLEGLPSVQRVDDEMPGLAVTMDGGRRSELVAALVAAGIAVETVTARRRLEDAFLGLVEGM